MFLKFTDVWGKTVYIKKQAITSIQETVSNDKKCIFIQGVSFCYHIDGDINTIMEHIKNTNGITL